MSSQLEKGIDTLDEFAEIEAAVDYYLNPGAEWRGEYVRALIRRWYAEGKSIDNIRTTIFSYLRARCRLEHWFNDSNVDQDTLYTITNGSLDDIEPQERE